jgi:hypothetical protein
MSRLMCLLTAAVPDHVLKDDPEKTKERLLIYPKRPADLLYRNDRCHSSHEDRDNSLNIRHTTGCCGYSDGATIQHMQAYISIHLSLCSMEMRSLLRYTTRNAETDPSFTIDHNLPNITSSPASSAPRNAFTTHTFPDNLDFLRRILLALRRFSKLFQLLLETHSLFRVFLVIRFVDPVEQGSDQTRKVRMLLDGRVRRSHLDSQSIR